MGRLNEWLSAIASKFQPAYDSIKKWELSPKTQVLLDNVWEALTPDIKKAIWSIVTLIATRYGEERAKSFLSRVLSAIGDNE